MLAVLAFVFALAVLVVRALVQVPVLTYLRYYALLVLGDIEPEFDLVRNDEGLWRNSEGDRYTTYSTRANATRKIAARTARTW